MKKNVTVVLLVSCLLCASCSAADGQPQDSTVGAQVSSVGAAEELIAVQDACTESQPEFTMADAIRENEMISMALADLTLNYQSGDWYGQPRRILDGKFLARVDSDYIMLQRQTDTPEKWVSSLVNVHLPVDRNVFDFVDSDIFTNDAGEEHYYWLDEKGVYCYELGTEIANWPIPGVERGKAFLTQYEDYAPCVYLQGQVIYCAPDGETIVVSDIDE